MTWWATHARRFNMERQEIHKLGSNTQWIEIGEWRVSNNLIVELDFEILHGDNRFPMTLRYPDQFPAIPPSIIPRTDERLSAHQYGAGGELCLEHRTDNWEPNITGAMMIESTYKLISAERLSDGKGEVPSSHQQSLGQRARARSCRILISKEMREHMIALPLNSIRQANFKETCLDGTFVATITAYSAEGYPDYWRTPIAKTDYIYSAIVLNVSDKNLDRKNIDVSAIALILASEGQAEAADKIENDENLTGLFLIDGDTLNFGFILRKDGNTKIIWYQIVDLPVEDQRLPSEYKILKDKVIGIVGCGSLGSKIATSLARAGVQKFVLVDDDVLLPGNIVRNDLDMKFIGHHKTNALEARLKSINSECLVDTRRIAFGGQESSGTTASTLGRLAECDILIDATANPQAFNLCSICVQQARIPLIWAEIFAGGIGGMLVRSRPDKDPPPQAARRQILSWCERQDQEWPNISNNNYESERTQQPPLVADDSDVTVIAAHTVKFIIDALIRPEESIFPASAYMIGFSKEWIFTQPFDTRPIMFSPEPWEIRYQDKPEEVIESFSFVASLLPKSTESDEDNSTARTN